MDTGKTATNAVVGVDKEKAIVYISIPLYVPAAKNWSNNVVRSFAFLFIFAIGKNFVALLGGYDKGLIAASKHSTVYVDIPVLQRRSYRLNLAFDALLYGRKDHPAVRLTFPDFG